MKSADVERAAVLVAAAATVKDALAGLDDALRKEVSAGYFAGVAVSAGACTAMQDVLPQIGWFQVDAETGRKIIEAAGAIIRDELAALGVE